MPCMSTYSTCLSRPGDQVVAAECLFVLFPGQLRSGPETVPVCRVCCMCSRCVAPCAFRVHRVSIPCDPDVHIMSSIVCIPCRLSCTSLSHSMCMPCRISSTLIAQIVVLVCAQDGARLFVYIARQAKSSTYTDMYLPIRPFMNNSRIHQFPPYL